MTNDVNPLAIPAKAEAEVGLRATPETERLMQWIISLLNQIAKLETAALANLPAKTEPKP